MGKTITPKTHPRRFKTFNIKCNIRHYTYSARVDTKTLKLFNIKAGCRTWPTFEHAKAHYDGALGRNSWTDRVILQPDALHTYVIQHGIASRMEARSILSALENKVKYYVKVEKRKRAEAKKLERALMLTRSPKKVAAKR